MRLKASVTVETAMIMPIVLLVIFFLLSISFLEHDKAVFSEQAFVESRSQVKMSEGMGDVSELCMSAKNVALISENNLTYVRSIITANTPIYLLNKRLITERQQSYVKCYAPDLIRLIRIGNKIKDSISQ